MTRVNTFIEKTKAANPGDSEDELADKIDVKMNKIMSPFMDEVRDYTLAILDLGGLFEAVETGDMTVDRMVDGMHYAVVNQFNRLAEVVAADVAQAIKDRFPEQVAAFVASIDSRSPEEDEVDIEEIIAALVRMGARDIEIEVASSEVPPTVA